MIDTTTLDLANESLIGRTGLIKVLKTILHSPGEPRLHSVTAIPSTTSVYMGADLVGEAGAVGFSYEHAIQGAIGECLERYSCAFMNPALLTYASEDELGPEAVGLDRWGIHSEAQYQSPKWPFPRYRKDKKITWARGRSLVTGEGRWVPACLVFVPFTPVDRDDLLTLAVSSGQSCHTSYSRALLTGLYEVIERDAFMISWLRKLALPRVDYLADPALAEMYRRHFADCELDFRVYDMTLDIAVPSMVCFCIGRSPKGPIMALGASTRGSAREAITKAILEAAQDMIWCRDLIRRKADWKADEDWGNLRDFEDHVRLWCEPEMLPHLSWLLDSDDVRPVPKIEPSFARTEDALADAVGHVARAGHDVIVIDTTAPDVAAAGFHAPKVMCPGLVPLTAVHRLQAFGSPRLTTVPRALGQAGRLDFDFNPIPHPFP